MNRIKELRKAHKMTISELGETLDIPKTTLNNYENGKRTPRELDTWEKIADFFNVSVSYVMGLSDNSENKIEKSDPKFVGKLSEFLRKESYSSVKDFVDRINIQILDQNYKLTTETYTLIENGEMLPTIEQAFAIARTGGYSLDAFLSGQIFNTYDYTNTKKVMENAGFPVNETSLQGVISAINDAKAMNFSFADIVQMHSHNNLETVKDKLIKDKSSLISYLEERRNFLLEAEQNEHIPDEIKMDIIIESASITEEINRQELFEEIFSKSPFFYNQ